MEDTKGSDVCCLNGKKEFDFAQALTRIVLTVRSELSSRFR